MKLISIKDNSIINRDELASVPKITKKISNKTLGQLEDEGIFVFPEIIKDAEDIMRDQLILQRVKDNYISSNVMGFLGLGDERLSIESRFGDEEDYLFRYLLEKVFDIPNLINMRTGSTNEEEIFNLLVFVFPYYLKLAMRKGAFKTYVRNNYNDMNVKGSIDIARHINKNTPFVGIIAYTKREYSYDNDLMELIRHTIEFIKSKSYGRRILLSVKDEVNSVKVATPSYSPHDRQKVINANRKSTINHAFYKEFRELQALCLLILQQQRHQIGFGNRQIYGLLFDGAWLWEEYINSLIGDKFYHPMNKGGKGAQRLFSNNRGLIYPDFISKDDNDRIIADAKYKPINNIGNRDYLQVLAYMLRFNAKKGYFLFPCNSDENTEVMMLNSGLSYENNVHSRDDICLVKHGLKIPMGASDYTDFVACMLESEKQFVSKLQS